MTSDRPTWWLLQETERGDRSQAVEGLAQMAVEPTASRDSTAPSEVAESTTGLRLASVLMSRGASAVEERNHDGIGPPMTQRAG